MYQALYRKWRPRRFDDVVGQEHITHTLQRQVQMGRLTHAYLFTGTRGTGKTSCAKILARAVNCQQPQDGNPCNECASCRGIEQGSILDVVELDAASNNRVDDVRVMLEEAVYTPATVAKRVYIIDEVHMLSPQAFNALLQILEEPPQHLLFIMATTELHKVPATIKSRCQQFAFQRIRPDDIARRLAYVAQHEGIDLRSEGAELIARLADGGMRDALSLLDQCVGAGGVVDEQRVFQVLGLAGQLQTVALTEEIGTGNLAGALERLDRLYTGGKEMLALAGELSALLRDLLVSKSAPSGGVGLLTGGYDVGTLEHLGQMFDVPRLVQMLALVQKTAGELVHSSNRRTDLELCLVMLCDPSLDGSVSGLMARVAALEQQLASGRRSEGDQGQRTGPVSHLDLSSTSERTEKDLEGDLQLDSLSQDQESQKREGSPVESTPWSESEHGKEMEGAPKPAQPTQSDGAVTPHPTWPGWDVVCAQLKPKLSQGDAAFFSMENLVSGRWDGAAVTIWAANDFLAQQVEKPVLTQAISETVGQVLGQRVPVKVCVGTAPPDTKAELEGTGKTLETQDALDAFLRAGHSNVTEEQ